MRERGWDFSKIDSLLSMCEKVLESYKSHNLGVPAALKAYLFATWFRSKIDGSENKQFEQDMKKIVELTMTVDKMEPFDPEKVADLGTIMIGIFDLIIKC